MPYSLDIITQAKPGNTGLVERWLAERRGQSLINISAKIVLMYFIVLNFCFKEQRFCQIEDDIFGI